MEKWVGQVWGRLFEGTLVYLYFSKPSHEILFVKQWPIGSTKFSYLILFYSNCLDGLKIQCEDPQKVPLAIFYKNF